MMMMMMMMMMSLPFLAKTNASCRERSLCDSWASCYYCSCSVNGSS